MYHHIVTVSKEEAEKLGRDVELTVLNPILEMFNYCIETKEKSGMFDRFPQDKQYMFFTTLMDIWNAGRVQGIREERSRRQKTSG